MKTLLSWLIANIEVFTTVVLIIVFEAYIFTADITAISSDDKWMLAVGGAMGVVAVKAIVGGVPTKNTIGDVVNLGVVVVAYVLIWVITSDEGEYHAFYAPSITVSHQQQRQPVRHRRDVHLQQVRCDVKQREQLRPDTCVDSYGFQVIGLKDGRVA